MQTPHDQPNEPQDELSGRFYITGVPELPAAWLWPDEVLEQVARDFAADLRERTRQEPLAQPTMSLACVGMNNAGLAAQVGYIEKVLRGEQPGPREALTPLVGLGMDIPLTYPVNPASHAPSATIAPALLNLGELYYKNNPATLPMLVLLVFPILGREINEYNYREYAKKLSLDGSSFEAFTAAFEAHSRAQTPKERHDMWEGLAEESLGLFGLDISGRRLLCNLSIDEVPGGKIITHFGKVMVLPPGKSDELAMLRPNFHDALYAFYWSWNRLFLNDVEDDWLNTGNEPPQD